MLDQDRASAFWAEMSACEHFVQIYEADGAFMDTLAGFISGGLTTDQAAVVIATRGHRQELDKRLMALGIDVDAARAKDQLISLDAEETLATFMVGGWPDSDLFKTAVTGILGRATRAGRKVRVFGEMVALLWAKGECGATVRLEYLWHQICQDESFALFCAYPKVGFTEDPSQSIARVCAAHSKVLAA